MDQSCCEFSAHLERIHHISADQLKPLTTPPETDLKNTSRWEQNHNLNRLENRDEEELNDLLQDKLLGVQHSADIIQLGDAVEQKEDPQDIMITWYRKYCKKHKIRARQPVLKRIRYACNRLNFKLQELGLMKEEFLPLICLIQECGRVEEVDFSFNSVGAFGLKVIRPILLNNPFLVVLNLAGSQLGAEGAAAIGDILAENTPLECLNLSNNHITDSSTVRISNGLKKNTRLRKLDLSRNSIESQEPASLAKALYTNSTLKRLSLHWNKIHSNGAVEFAKMLKYNKGLHLLDLSWNGFALRGTEALCEGLTRNKSLEELDLKSNRIELRAVLPLTKGLQQNSTLKVLRLGLNPLTLSGVHQLLHVLEHTATSGLTVLDLEGIQLNEKLTLIAHRISNSRPFTLLNENCVSWETSGGKYAKQDPMTFLMNYLNKHGIRIVDFYRLIDLQQAGMLSRAEFIEGVLQQKIPLNANDLQTILDYIDHENTNQITHQLFFSRMYLYRITVRDQIRVRAGEFSKHQLDQNRLFVRPKGLSDIEKPPEGFPSKSKATKQMKPTGDENKRRQLNGMERAVTSKESMDSKMSPVSITVKGCKLDEQAVSSMEFLRKLEQGDTQSGVLNSESSSDNILVPILDVFDESYFRYVSSL
ncbi:hypothetical protein CRM22_007791 [Opisthorchis felineus]|uniref:EF-hand domain-containing protein n=1 Tax=Opisthorchis felineus TaxID=147828 RepID=A0A4V3SDS2_OPIFE|nr:hypothetical protein CRM22_007791 [Opisthorchis felineus]